VELAPSTVTALAVAALAAALAALAVAGVALAGKRKVQRAYRVFSGHRRVRPDDDVLALLERHIDEVSNLRSDVGEAHRQGQHLRDLLRSTVSRVATVRYDAFEDMGGRMSFSIALLDEHGDGTVITSLNGRSDTRVYIKQLVGGASSQHLSGEEAAAVEQAMAMAGRSGRGRRRKAS
jgi:hypothetical protein